MPPTRCTRIIKVNKKEPGEDVRRGDSRGQIGYGLPLVPLQPPAPAPADMRRVPTEAQTGREL